MDCADDDRGDPLAPGSLGPSPRDFMLKRSVVKALCAAIAVLMGLFCVLRVAAAPSVASARVTVRITASMETAAARLPYEECAKKFEKRDVTCLTFAQGFYRWKLRMQAECTDVESQLTAKGDRSKNCLSGTCATRSAREALFKVVCARVMTPCECESS
mmetsp:Transcript_13999/g.32921  ORF Transcript_13999/g.32921 Transcript_13999/m.32921 type:complete len:159 (-) Transcript_13999:81-557(-)|eukprot:CAMPEP_0171103896 /NCGR_PEP_ID=MMETSP0766_2-20121228/59608_1 /TAXON_ID=439317 /ORGANISM="Gambierdiscus australes, Strain CAWD 149" /LENGTH=158 /DNA_ID=CAMNT_0011564409 /DNA_START=43 /DNA_END=519 /DNA_ORIENTATION=+